VKIAISVPDPVFQAAEKASKRLRLSRSRFYAKAVEAYVQEHSGADVTRRLDEVYAKKAVPADPAWGAAALEVLRREKW
jgi:hypothetical protein